MSKSKIYENLTNEYLSICELREKLDFAGAFMQFSLITHLTEKKGLGCKFLKALSNAITWFALTISL
ncbi:MAG: hypothetical protein P0S93_00445 [Candidatus Neptunochlamydia sp.]|nr:hypothetical protein [Candidatus Neptunochlamydia sp.]